MYNKAILMGRICNDIEPKTTPSGTSVVSFRLAVDRKYQADKNNRQTDFLNIVAWRNTAEFVDKYFSKGDMIMVDGEIQTRKYQDKTTGKDVFVTEIIADSVSFCGSKSSNEYNHNGAPPVAASVPPVTIPATNNNDDDYPF